MLKVLKGLFVLLGLVGLAIGIYFLVSTMWNLQEVMGAAESNRSRTLVNPTNKIYILAGAAALGGLLLGLGIGIPTRTAGGIRKEALEDAADRREAAIRQRATAATTDDAPSEEKA